MAWEVFTVEVFSRNIDGNRGLFQSCDAEEVFRVRDEQEGRNSEGCTAGGTTGQAVEIDGKFRIGGRVVNGYW